MAERRQAPWPPAGSALGLAVRVLKKGVELGVLVAVAVCSIRGEALAVAVATGGVVGVPISGVAVAGMSVAVAVSVIEGEALGVISTTGVKLDVAVGVLLAILVGASVGPQVGAGVSAAEAKSVTVYPPPVIRAPQKVERPAGQVVEK